MTQGLFLTRYLSRPCVFIISKAIVITCEEGRVDEGGEGRGGCGRLAITLNTGMSHPHSLALFYESFCVCVCVLPAFAGVYGCALDRAGVSKHPTHKLPRALHSAHPAT